uniref:Uncharacterized protein n=1 Tax=Cacopsylla melanoneura TaxID=428564 RepID=A0A8D8YRW2_9HEMI
MHDKKKQKITVPQVIPKLYCESIEIDCPDHEISYRSRPSSPTPYSGNHLFARSPSPLTFRVPDSSRINDKLTESQPPAPNKVSTFLELPEQFRSRSKSLDDGKRKPQPKKLSHLDCASTYKIYDSILKKVGCQ